MKRSSDPIKERQTRLKEYNQYWVKKYSQTGATTVNTVRDRNHSFYLSSRWRSTRLIVLNDNPICQVCLIEPAFHVHHIEPLHSATGWSNRLNFDYLMSICIPCHGKETANEQ